MATTTNNLHGTGAEALAEQAYEVHEAMQTALEKLRAAKPNGRDYPDSAEYTKAHEKYMEDLRKMHYLSEKYLYKAEEFANQ